MVASNRASNAWPRLPSGRKSSSFLITLTIAARASTSDSAINGLANRRIAAPQASRLENANLGRQAATPPAVFTRTGPVR